MNVGPGSNANELHESRHVMLDAAFGNATHGKTVSIGKMSQKIKVRQFRGNVTS